jgi:NRAMP (natural resistance-associated macrophage protein)-like metal ion transporter
MAFEIEQPVDAGPSPVVEPIKPRLLGVLGPGLITGASDDDPSGIATYSQAGAQFGYALTWTMLFTYPLMMAVQIVSARMGRTTGRGIAGNLRQHCPPWLLTGIVVLLLIANAINIGADLGAMADASRLVIGGPQILYVLLFAVICIALQIFLQYTRYVSVFKWLTLFLFGYVACMFMVKVPWSEAAKSLVIPSLRWDKDYLTTVVAVLGTTISPYLLFWQASQEAEDVRTVRPWQILKRAPHQGERALNRIHLDTFVGMGFSNFIALAIMITAAATLHANNVTDIQTSAQAAEALRPIAGPLAETIFALGVIGTGMLSVPVLAGSAAYAVGEARKWPTRPPADGSQGLLRSHLHRDDRRHDDEFHSDRSDPGLVLECCNQRCGRRSRHGDHDVAGRRAEGHGRVRRCGVGQRARLGGNRGHGASRRSNVGDLIRNRELPWTCAGVVTQGDRTSGTNA